MKVLSWRVMMIHTHRSCSFHLPSIHSHAHLHVHTHTQEGIVSLSGKVGLKGTSVVRAKSRIVRPQ